MAAYFPGALRIAMGRSRPSPLLALRDGAESNRSEGRQRAAPYFVRDQDGRRLAATPQNLRGPARGVAETQPYFQRQHVRHGIHPMPRTEATCRHGGIGAAAARGAGRLAHGLRGTHGSWTRELGRFGGAVRSADRYKRIIDVPVSAVIFNFDLKLDEYCKCLFFI